MKYPMENTTLKKAQTFMYRNARPLDLPRFQYHFENGSKEMDNIMPYLQEQDTHTNKGGYTVAQFSFILPKM